MRSVNRLDRKASGLEHVLHSNRNTLQATTCIAVGRIAIWIKASSVRIRSIMTVGRDAAATGTQIVMSIGMVRRHRVVDVRAEILVDAMLPCQGVKIGRVVYSCTGIRIVLPRIAVCTVSVTPSKMQAIVLRYVLAERNPVP